MRSKIITCSLAEKILPHHIPSQEFGRNPKKHLGTDIRTQRTGPAGPSTDPYGGSGRRAAPHALDAKGGGVRRPDGLLLPERQPSVKRVHDWGGLRRNTRPSPQAAVPNTLQNTATL